VKCQTILALIACLLAVAIPVLAQSTANYDLSWHVVAGGGGRLESAGYTLLGTAGQPVVDSLTGSSYSLTGGFWSREIYQVYLPLVLSLFP
jgi:hypothetical protein